MKAIHNAVIFTLPPLTVVINRKTTKFESNSQPRSRCRLLRRRCYQSQNYKIWKQFTTRVIGTTGAMGCYQSQNYKIWNQFTTVHLDEKPPICCYQSQNYKIWKQFTTSVMRWLALRTMLSITKLQNLKAIHNCVQRSIPMGNDVINHKTTKFESNSQLDTHSFWFEIRCYQSQNYKIWK